MTFDSNNLPQELLHPEEENPIVEAQEKLKEYAGVVRPYNRFQLSKMVGDYQVVIRADEISEFLTLMNQLSPIVEKLEQKSGKVPQPPVVGTVKTCPLHGVVMIGGISKKGKEYWAHKNVEGMRCFGDGFKPKNF